MSVCARTAAPGVAEQGKAAQTVALAAAGREDKHPYTVGAHGGGGGG